MVGFYNLEEISTIIIMNPTTGEVFNIIEE